MAAQESVHQLRREPEGLWGAGRSMAVSVLNYLRIDRVDQAEKAVKAMSAIDDDSTVTQLATAWVNIFLVLHQRPPPPPPPRKSAHAVRTTLAQPMVGTAASHAAIKCSPSTGPRDCCFARSWLDPLLGACDLGLCPKLRHGAGC